MKEFSHLNKQGEIDMVDINHKKEQTRIAKASGKILLQAETIRAIKQISLKKGDVITIAKMAGIQAAKQTSCFIPLCHQLNLEKVSVDVILGDNFIEVTSLAKSFGKTGVEMEALMAVQVALLTIYDMCKAVDKSMIIQDVKLVSKEKV